MNTLDGIVVVAAVAVLLTAGYLASLRRAKNTNNFILGGRRLPWWLGGTAMVAGASNADSPLHQSAKIRREGVAGAWFYWSQAFAQAWHGLVFGRLWRRSELSTTVEFYDIRYAGRAAVCGRVWSMVFASFIEGTLGLALGLLAMIKICQVLLGLTAPVHVLGYAVTPEIVIVMIGVGLAISYSTVSGLLGVVAGDIVEFFLAIGSSYLLMYFVYREVGYAEGLREGLAKLGRSEMVSFAPHNLLAVLTFFIIQPVATLAGNNTLNQRFLAMRDERQAMFSGIWRILNHFFVRCWPWYVCGLASVLLVPEITASEQIYPRLIADYLPAGFRGVMFAGFLVAFMSSVSSNMHSSGSVFVNDFYRPFLVKGASDRHYLWAIRAAMLLMTVLATWIALASDNILKLLQFAMTMSAAAGFVMLLRWFWWRVNGWADFAAQLVSLPVTLFFVRGLGQEWVRVATVWCGGSTSDDNYGVAFLFTVATTTALWLLVMLATPPEPAEKLAAFFRKVRPYGFWGPVARVCPDCVVTDSFRTDLRLYAYGLTLSLSLLFGMGLLLLGRPGLAAVLLVIGALAGRQLVRGIDRLYAAPTAGSEQACGP